MARLLLCVQYVHEENIEKKLLFCRPLVSHTRGGDIFVNVSELLRLQLCNGKNAFEYVTCSCGVGGQRWASVLDLLQSERKYK